ncbi:MAG: efflux RND transporter periplasmic adaptor subunit [Phycisphaerae bacterium]|nr:efflux RND transporter periplasmic adaptor subunit [Phycisphaerae bacterium]
MNRLGTLLGLILLLAGALGVYYLFQGKHGEIPEEQDGEMAVQVNVHVGEISRSVMHGYVLAYGRVEPAPASGDSPPAKVRITAPVDRIISEAVCVEGQEVSQGDVLFRFDSRAVEVTVKEARQAVEFAERNFVRQKELMQSQGTSEKLLQQAEYELAHAKDELTRAETELSLFQVTAPISGTIVRVLARPGEAVGATSILAELVDRKRLIVEFRVPSDEITVLKPGQKVTIETRDRVGGPNSEMGQVHGELTFIDSVVDPDSDTILARASVATESELRPGRFVRVRAIYLEKSDCLVVPEESLVTTTEGQIVIAIIENGKAFQRVVQRGLRENGMVEIQGEGIHEGMQIVTAGVYGLLPETKVRIITE